MRISLFLLQLPISATNQTLQAAPKRRDSRSVTKLGFFPSLSSRHSPYAENHSFGRYKNLPLAHREFHRYSRAAAMALARATFISLLGALFDRLQLQAAAELSKRLTELLPSSAREKTKRSPSSRASADVPDTAAIFAGFPRQCSFYEQMLIALLSASRCCFVKVLTLLVQKSTLIAANKSSRCCSCGSRDISSTTRSPVQPRAPP